MVYRYLILENIENHHINPGLLLGYERIKSVGLRHLFLRFSVQGNKTILADISLTLQSYLYFAANVFVHHQLQKCLFSKWK